MIDIEAKAAVLIEALPWIRRFAGSTIVIKYGGNAMVSPQVKHAFAQDVAFLHHVGLKPVVVHGGGPQINEMLGALGITSEFKGGLRVTSDEAMDVVRMVLTGKVQRELVSLINADAPYAVGLSGEDAGMIRGVRKRLEVDGEAVDLGHVGEVSAVHPEPIQELLDAGRIPVVSTIAVGEDGDVLNVNADTAAGAIASALGALKLVMLTDVEGLYRTWPDPSTLISHITAEEARQMLPDLADGMKPKLEAALAALSGGVPAAHIIDGRVPHSMLLEIFTDDGVGTIVRNA